MQLLPGKLREIRKSRGLTQTQLANLLGPGYTQSTISHIENGYEWPDLSECILLGAVLGVELNKFVTEEWLAKARLAGYDVGRGEKMKEVIRYPVDIKKRLEKILKRINMVDTEWQD